MNPVIFRLAYPIKDESFDVTTLAFNFLLESRYCKIKYNLGGANISGLLNSNAVLCSGSDRSSTTVSSSNDGNVLDPRSLFKDTVLVGRSTPAKENKKLSSISESKLRHNL
ncbi:LOW QUALITY PROTEIN: hypothetical protein V1477_017111 [Vespula maculifrons]|uniref:Uncharacterized protein n=1 Tax=Vespula maculifrons TaxID=7453 RepID=A0ABD2B535_VESMC